MKNLITAIEKLSRLMGQMEEDAKVQFKFNELTLTQMHYLETICHLNNPSITELASEMKLTKPTVTVSIDKLIEREYVLKIHSDEDRRSTHLHLTEKGKLINLMHDYAHKRLAELVLKALEGEEVEQLTLLIQKIVRPR